MRGVRTFHELAHSWRKAAKVQVHLHCFASDTLYDNDNRYHLIRQYISQYFLISFSYVFLLFSIYILIPLKMDKAAYTKS